MAAGAVTAALVVGFLAGLLTFKVKARWCPRCGSLTYAAAAPEGGDGVASARPLQQVRRLGHRQS
jgi:hypothetical protein